MIIGTQDVPIHLSKVIISNSYLYSIQLLLPLEDELRSSNNSLRSLFISILINSINSFLLLLTIHL
jgi:hypothetical protein